MVNNILKTVIFNARITNTDELKRYLPQVWAAIDGQAPDQQRIEMGVLHQIFKLVACE